MSGLGRSLKPSYLRLRPPGLTGRSMSNSSDLSAASSPGSEEQFVLSRDNTPARETPPSRDRMTASGDALDQDKIQYAPYRPNSPRRSHPIAIDLPATRKFRSGSASKPTPPVEPLSGRGDQPGGYFPNHEDGPRVYRPHPFYKASQEARQRSIALAAEESSLREGDETFAAAHLAASDNMPPQAQPGSSKLSAAIAASRSRSSSHTPVASYMPGGHDNPLPMGKYYPSNYENRPAATTAGTPAAQTPRPTPSAGSKSELLVPRRKTGAGGAGDAAPAQHVRSDSDARRRLQQYQRDMVAQATMAANRVLVKRGTSSEEVLAHAGNALQAGGVHLGGTMSAHKPTSPRLAPLGSPGPVTPINLEAEGDAAHSGGYLTKGRMHSAGKGADEVRSAVKDGEDKIRLAEERRRKDLAAPVTPPAPDRIDLSPLVLT